MKNPSLRLEVRSVITGFGVTLDVQVKDACIFVASLVIISLNDSLLFKLPKVRRSHSFTIIIQDTLTLGGKLHWIVCLSHRRYSKWIPVFFSTRPVLTPSTATPSEMVEGMWLGVTVASQRNQSAGRVLVS